MIRFIEEGLVTVQELMEADDELLGSLHAPVALKQLLPALRDELLLRDAKRNLLRDDDIDTNSRLWIERNPTEGGITKVEYKTLTRSTVVWEMGATNKHNLQTVDELQVSISANTMIELDTFPEGVRAQFHQGLLTALIRRINSEEEVACLTDIYALTGIGGNRGEMIFQQAVFPPLVLALVAAASHDTTTEGETKTYSYIADQNAVSSAFVCYANEAYGVSGKPDAGLLMPGSNDLIAMLALLPEYDLNHQDIAKCILWSSIVAQALVRAGVPQDQVQVPFTIGSGVKVSLFVTEILDGDDDNFCPKVR